MDRKAMREKIDLYCDSLISVKDMFCEKATEQEEKFIFAVNEMRHYGEREFLYDGSVVDRLREAAESMAECESSKLNLILSNIESSKYKGVYIPENIKEYHEFIKETCEVIKNSCENLCNIADFLKDEYSKELGKNEIELSDYTYEEKHKNDKVPTEEDLLNMLYPKEKEVPELCECIQKCKDDVTLEQMLDDSKNYDYDAHDDFDDFDEI